MNSLVFNHVAQELKTTIYGVSGGVATPLAVNGTGNIETLILANSSTDVATPLNISDAGNLLVEFTSSSTLSTQPVFTSYTVDNQTIGAATLTLLSDTDISTLKVASLFIYNTSTAADTITYTIYTSPVTTQTSYIADTLYGEVGLAQNAETILSIPTHAHYFEVVATGDAATAATTIYLNGQS